MQDKKVELWYLFLRVKTGDQQALTEILHRFEPLILSEAKINGTVDEDVAQEIREKFFTELKKQFQASAY